MGWAVVRAFGARIRPAVGWARTVSAWASPDGGQWVGLEALARSRPERRILGEFTSRSGTAGLVRSNGEVRDLYGLSAPAPNEFSSSDTVWIDDQLPTGASPTAGVGTRLRRQRTRRTATGGARGIHYHGDNPGRRTSRRSNGKLLAYVLIDPCDHRRRSRMQWDVGDAWCGHSGGRSTGERWGRTGRHRKTAGRRLRAGQRVGLEHPASVLTRGTDRLAKYRSRDLRGHAWFTDAGKTRRLARH
jgi:hypothetical protein